MANVPRADDLASIIQDLLRRVHTLETAPRASSTAIDSGTWTVYDPITGNAIVKLGELPPEISSGNPQYGSMFFRTDGTPAFGVWDDDTATFTQYAAIRDRTGRAVFSDDVAGEGIARPWLQVGTPVSLETPTWPGTTSAAFVDVLAIGGIKQQPNLFCGGYAFCDAGTAGQIRVMANGVQVGATIISSPAGTIFAWSVTGPVTGAFDAALDVRVQARLTTASGANRIRAVSTFCLGRQS